MDGFPALRTSWIRGKYKRWVSERQSNQACRTKMVFLELGSFHVGLLILEAVTKQVACLGSRGQGCLSCIVPITSVRWLGGLLLSK